jgi:hypothetical protein
VSKLKTGFFWLILAALAFVPVGLAEVYLRSIGLGHPILFYANASYRFAPQPDQKQVRLRGAAVTIDSKGLRGTRDWTDHADAKVLFVGDSVTWGGTYIDDKDLFSEGSCARLGQATGKTFVCGNAGANQYGTDNIAERIRYKNVDDESALVVTLIAPDTVRGLVDAEGRYFFMRQPPQPFPALWEAITFVTWTFYKSLRPYDYRADDDFRVAERSLDNLFAAIRETQRRDRKVLIVLSPVERELNGRESALTKHVQSIIERSGFEVLDLHHAVSTAITGDFYYDTVHLDVRGHHFYAEQIADVLVREMNAANGRAQSPNAN